MIVRDAGAMGHKIAVRAVAAGAEVRNMAGRSAARPAPITVGDQVHVHNIATGLGATSNRWSDSGQSGVFPGRV